MKFYRYQPINKYTLSNLAQGKNWVANPFDFNDPFEFRMTEIYYTNSEGELTYLDEKSMKARILYKEKLGEIGVICYSSKEIDTLMYSHYSDHHMGMCLVFDVLPKNMISMRKVNYKDNLGNFHFSLNKDKLKDEIIRICTTKSTVWTYEDEYRQIFTNKHFLADYPGKLTEIIFGCKTTKSDIELVISLLNSKVQEMEISKTFISVNTFMLGKSTISCKEDGTFEVPQLWDGIHEA